jgi:hypothetical protein
MEKEILFHANFLGGLMIDNDDFKLNEVQLKRLHESILETNARQALEDEALDGISVTFMFIPAFGRFVIANIGGFEIEIEGVDD